VATPDIKDRTRRLYIILDQRFQCLNISQVPVDADDFPMHYVHGLVGYFRIVHDLRTEGSLHLGISYPCANRYRHGTLSLYAALDTKTGKVVGKTANRRTSKEFVEFLGELVAQRPARQEIHIILDNRSARRTGRGHLAS
jgi:hypothetical protein